MQIYSNQWQWILQVTWLLICILNFNLKNTIPVKKYQVLLNVFSKEIFRDVTGREIRIENFSDQSNFCVLEVIRFPVRNQNVQHNFDLQASFFTSTQKT